jgi:hypothetical protein
MQWTYTPVDEYWDDITPVGQTDPAICEQVRQAYQFGRRVQRVHDAQSDEAIHTSIWLGHMLCAVSGFMAGMIVAGILTFWKLGLAGW